MVENDTLLPRVARTLLSVLRLKGRKLKRDFHGYHAAIADRSVRATQKSRRADMLGAAAPMCDRNVAPTRKRYGITDVVPFLFGLVLFFISATDAGAVEAFIPSETMDGIYVGKHVEHLVDPTRNLTLADVRSEAQRSQFVPVNRDTLDFGLSNAAHWIHLTVGNPAAKEVSWVLQAEHPLLNRIEVYEVARDGKATFHEGGTQIPFNRRDIAYRKSAFSMSSPPGTTEIYVKVWSDVKIMVANCTFSAWGTSRFIAKNNVENLVLGLYYGALLVMLLYNLFIYFSVKDTAYLFYVSYIVFSCLSYFVINGLVFQYLWLASPGAGLGYAMLAFTSVVFFSRVFLDTREKMPRIDKILLAYAAVLLVNSLLTFTQFATIRYISPLGYLSSLALAPLLLYTGIRSLKTGIRQARYYVVAWAMYLAGTVLYFLKDLGVLHYSFVTAYSLQIGTLGDVVLLSFALADRIKVLREEKAAAEAKTIEVLLKSKEELEGQVALKTEEHRKAREEAENATRLKDKFVNLVTHDLKSPLSGLTMGLELLRSDDEIPAAHRQFLGRMAVNSRELLNMTCRLLDLSRLQTGRIILRKRFINCRHFAATQAALYQTAAAQKEIFIVNDIPEEMKVYADPDLFGECVKNLMSNAIKFCGKSDTITLFNPAGMASTIAVKDNGPGIEPEKMASLFAAEMKERSLGTAGEMGTGIGLPHTKELMEAQGGTITVESAPGKGTIFFLTLPSTFNVTVLVVDDQEVVRMGIKEHCAGAFPSVLEAGNGAEAMEIIKNVTPHLILTDINMPVMSGLAFIQQVRNGGAARHVPIIAMTSDESWPTPNGMDIRSYCLHIGADDFVNKPVAASDLMPRMTRLLSSMQAAQ